MKLPILQTMSIFTLLKKKFNSDNILENRCINGPYSTACVHEISLQSVLSSWITNRMNGSIGFFVDEWMPTCVFFMYEPNRNCNWMLRVVELPLRIIEWAEHGKLMGSTFIDIHDWHSMIILLYTTHTPFNIKPDKKW